MSSCLRGSSFFRRRDSFEEEDVGGKGVVKKIPIEMKQRRNLATSLRSVGSFGAKRQKGASLRSALSVELDGQETEKVKKEFEMYRLNKENEIANFKKKEQKLENENRRLRGELQAMQKTVAKLLYERDEAYIDVQQALERSATFETERDKIQRQFKIFREGKEEELQTILRTKRELERRLSSNRGRPGTGGNNNNAAPLNNIVETEITAMPNHGGDIPLTETALNQNAPHRNSVDWWMMGQSPCFDREPSIGSMTQLHTSMTLPGGYGGGERRGGERAFMGSATAHRKVSSTSSLLFGGRGGGVGGAVDGLTTGLAAAEIVSVSQFGTPTGLDVGGDSGGVRGEEWARAHVGGGSLGQSRNSQIGYEPLNPSFRDDGDNPIGFSVFRLYVSAPSDVQTELTTFQHQFVPRLQSLCARHGRTLLFLHLPPDELQPNPFSSPSSSSAAASSLESIDIDLVARLHSQLPKTSAIFLSFLNERLDTFTKDEIHYGFLQKRESQLLGAVFCFRDDASEVDKSTVVAPLSSSAFTTSPTTAPVSDFKTHRTSLSELNALKAEIADAEKCVDERKKNILHVGSAEEAALEAGKAIEALLHRALDIPENLEKILSDDVIDEELSNEQTTVDVNELPIIDALANDGLADRESLWLMRLTGTSGCDLVGDVEHEETLRQCLDSICELGFESHYQELTSHLTSAGPLPPLLISGQPGTGKSLLLAKWLSLILEERRATTATSVTRTSAFCPHHQFAPLVLYHSVADSQSISGVPHHALYRFTVKLLDHVPTYSSPPASLLGRVTSDPSRLQQEFPKRLESVSTRLPGGVVLVLDHADRFQDAETQLSWLLDPLPVDVRVFVAADEDSCPKSWKSWPTLTVESLSNNQIRELLVASFMTVNKPFQSDLLSLIQRHCRSPATTSPLYVSVLAAYLRWKSSFELDMKTAVAEALEKLNCVDLMKHVLAEVDAEYDGRICARGMLRRFLALILASRSGISENNIFRIIGLLGNEEEIDGENGATVAWHRWAVISEVLIDAKILRHRGGVLTFANPQARQAVGRAYPFTPECLVDFRQKLIDFYRRELPRRDPRTVDELLWLLLQVGDREQLRVCLREIDVFVSLFARGRTNELLRFWTVVVGAKDKINAMSSAYLEALKAAADAAEMGAGDETKPMSLTRVAAIYEALGRFFRSMAYFDHASTPLERALELRESLDPDSAEVGRSLVQLAQLNAEWRKYSTAEALFRNALELFEGLYGAEHAEVAMALEAMALLYQRQGKHEVARPLQRRADSIKLKKRREKIEVARAQSAHRRFGDLTIAPTKGISETPIMNLASTASPKRSVIERQKQIASTFFNHGVRLCQQGKHGNALPLFQGALAVFESALGPSHPLVDKTLRNVALVKFHLGDLEAAAKFYKKAIDMRAKPNGLGGSELLTSSVEELDRQKLESGVVEAHAAKLSSDSRRSSSDTMSTVKVGDDNFGHHRAASTK